MLVLLNIILALLLTACGDDSGGGSSADPKPLDTSAPAATATPTPTPDYPELIKEVKLDVTLAMLSTAAQEMLQDEELVTKTTKTHAYNDLVYDEYILKNSFAYKCETSIYSIWTYSDKIVLIHDLETGITDMHPSWWEKPAGEWTDWNN